MTLHQNVQQRAVMHNRRSKLSAFQNRDIVDPAKIIKPTDTTPTKPVDTTSTNVAAPVPPSASAAIEKSASATSSSSSTSSSASTSSSSATSSSSSVTTSSTTHVLSTPTSLSASAHVTPTSTPRIVSHTASSSATAAAASNSAAVSTTSGLRTGTLIGIIGGSILGVVVVCMAVAFFLRRFRTKQRGVDAFNSSQFRRSAALLDEKDQPDFRPRPPSMIERRNAQPSAPFGGAQASANDFPPPPSMAYPYSDQVSASTAVPQSMYGAGPGGSDHGHGQYGAANPQYSNLPPPPPPPSQNSAYSAIPGAYGVPPPGAFGSHYEQAGYGAPPVPGTYAPGAYASYGAPDPRYPHPQYQYQQQPQQGYPQHSNYQQLPAQHAGYGPRTDSLATSNSAVSEKQSLRLASSSEESSLSRALTSSSTSSAGSPLARQPTQSSGAPPAYMDDGEGTKWAARSDVKVKPVVLSPPTNGAMTGSSSATASAEGTAKQNGARPVSTHSAYLAYDQEDAYGGM